MSRREEIEASLRTQIDRELLAVYADVLQTEGDPRGELVAIDLHAEAHGLSHELASRRAELLRSLVELDGGGLRSQFGWIDVDLSGSDITALARVLASPFAPYLRDVVVWGAGRIHAVVAMLAQAPRPWLVRLSLEGSERGAWSIVGHAATAALAQATPHLAHLELRGGGILEGLDHRAVRTLRVHGRTTMASLVGEGAMLDAVDTIDLVLPAEDARTRLELLPAERLPALRRLDLGRNAPPDLERFVDCLDVIEPLAILSQLTHLRLPALRSIADAQRLDAIVARMPDLVELELSAHLSELRPAVTVEPMPRSWRCLDRVHSRPPLRAEVPSDPDHVFALDIGEAASVLEASYDALPDDARTAWDTWFNMGLRGQEWGGSKTHVRQTVPAIRLRDALTPCIDRFTSHDWRALYVAIEHADGPLHYWTYYRMPHDMP